MSGATTAEGRFEAFLEGLRGRPEWERASLVEQFMHTTRAFPLLEGETTAHFLYTGNAERVTIPGDMNGWNPSGSPMQRIEGTDFWYHSCQFESNARIDYKFLVDGSNWIPDPRNPLRVEGSYGWNSELRMPRYRSPREIEPHPAIPHGSIYEAGICSQFLANSRDIRIYTPPGYMATDQCYPVVVFHDGVEFLSMGCAGNILNYLIAQRRMRPVIGVFVPPVNRNAEYSGPQMGAFHAFIVEEVLPFVDARYRTLRTAAERATIGVSNGGNIALWLGHSYPEVFGNIAAMSSNVVTAVFEAYEESPRLNLKFYLDIGTYDQEELKPRIREFVELLRLKGYQYQFRKYHEGHSWGSWRAHVGRALTMFFPQDELIGISPSKALRSSMMQNHLPDALTPSDAISIVIPEDGRFTLKVLDLAGRDVRTVLDGRLARGEHRIRLGLEGMRAGVYSYVLSGENFNLSRKFQLVPAQTEDLFSHLRMDETGGPRTDRTKPG